MKDIITSLKNKYSPSVLIVYGSYADGSNKDHSDFDALVIAEVGEPIHDTSVVCGVRLDVFVYPTTYFDGAVDENEILQIHDGIITVDNFGTGARLKQRVTEYIDSQPRKTREENVEQIEWCKKMLLRAERGDAEGFFRHHWLLCDSLQIYCDIVGAFYFGPKKALKLMARTDPRAYAIYTKSLECFDYEALKEWIDYLARL